MGDLIFTDFQTKDRQYTKGGGIDDLNVFARTMSRAFNPAPPPNYNQDTAPSEYSAPESDPA
jgi:hypothetical protein